MDIIKQQTLNIENIRNFTTNKNKKGKFYDYN